MPRIGPAIDFFRINSLVQWARSVQRASQREREEKDEDYQHFHTARSVCHKERVKGSEWCKSIPGGGRLNLGLEQSYLAGASLISTLSKLHSSEHSSAAACAAFVTLGLALISSLFLSHFLLLYCVALISSSTLTLQEPAEEQEEWESIKG